MPSEGTGLAPYAMTVLGPIDPIELGFTLTHEHLYIDTTLGYHPDSGDREKETGSRS